MKNCNIIVAKYDENIEWLNEIKDTFNIYLYDKKRFIPNIGRETETYIQYILNYFSLINEKDLYFFTQGNPFVHHETFLTDIKYTYSKRFYGTRTYCDRKGNPSHTNLNCDEFISLFIPTFNDDIIEFYTSALFCLTGKDILKYNKNFYERLYEYICKEVTAPWIVERFFYQLYK